MLERAAGIRIEKRHFLGELDRCNPQPCKWDMLLYGGRGRGREREHNGYESAGK